jgi:hypothetical protein
MEACLDYAVRLCFKKRKEKETYKHRNKTVTLYQDLTINIIGLTVPFKRKRPSR